MHDAHKELSSSSEVLEAAPAPPIGTLPLPSRCLHGRLPQQLPPLCHLDVFCSHVWFGGWAGNQEGHSCLQAHSMEMCGSCFKACVFKIWLRKLLSSQLNYFRARVQNGKCSFKSFVKQTAAVRGTYDKPASGGLPSPERLLEVLLTRRADWGGPSAGVFWKTPLHLGYCGGQMAAPGRSHRSWRETVTGMVAPVWTWGIAKCRVQVRVVFVFNMF